MWLSLLLTLFHTTAVPLAPSSDEDGWSPSGLSIALAHWFFRNENMLDFLLATQHHSSPSTLSPIAGTRSMEGTFPGIPCQQVCTWDLPMKGTHIGSGKQKRSRRHVGLLRTGGQTRGLQGRPWGPAAASRYSLLSVGATVNCAATGNKAYAERSSGKHIYCLT